MSRESFSQRDVERSEILTTVSANLDLIRRMEDLTMTEFAKMVGVSDRFLDKLIRQKTNVSFLVLEKIADRLRIPLLTLIGARLDARIPGGEIGFLRTLQRENLSNVNAGAREASVRRPQPVYQEPETLRGMPSELKSRLDGIMEWQSRILQNQTDLNRQLAELDAWLSNNPLRNRSGGPTTIQ